MDKLAAKLYDLSYEFFGILVPGIVFLTLLGLWLGALGPMLPHWTGNVLPQFSHVGIADYVAHLESELRLGVGVPSVIFAYLFGHGLHWRGRTAKAPKSVKTKPPTTGSAAKSLHSSRTDQMLARTRRLWICISESDFWIAVTELRMRRPNDSYPQSMQPMFELLAKSFGEPGKLGSLSWATFFPIARIYVQPRLATSLISIYQHKYTFHRTLGTGAAFVFDLSVVALLVTLVPSAHPPWSVNVNRVLLVVLALLCALLVRVASESYRYYWSLFGSAVIAETYALLHEPTHAEP